MFKIKYAISNEKKKLLKQYKTAYEFDCNVGDIEGQFYINCNGNEIGFVDKEIPDYGEFLSMWMRLLNDGLFYLEKNGYYAQEIPESASHWLEFERIENKIYVREVEFDESMLDAVLAKHYHNMKGKWRDTVLTSKRVEKKITKWTEAVSESELFPEILSITELYLKEIATINEVLISSTVIKKLMKSFQEAHAIVNKINI